MLFVGDDWAEDDHDIEVQDDAGRVLARARLPEGIAGIARLHALIGQFAGPDTGPGEVVIGIETDRGLWVTALRAAGYTVFAINPRQVSRYRERHGTSGAKSDKADAHTMADMVRTDSHQLRPVAGDSADAEAIKVAARAHPDAAIYLSQPGIGEILGARALGEFGDDPHRYAGAKARKNYSATSPITRQSGKKKIVLARFIRNDRLADALHRQAQSALIASPGARAFYDQQRDRGLDHDAALRTLSNRLVGILHGCLKTRSLYDEATAWSHRAKIATAA